MLEFEPEKRITFESLAQKLKPAKCESTLSPESTIAKNTLITPPVNTKPKQDSFSASPAMDSKLDHSRTRSPGMIRKNLPIGDRDSKNSFSPILKDHQDISF